MTEPKNTTDPQLPSQNDDVAAAVFKPVLIRAGIGLIFGVVTLILQEPTAATVNYGLAIFFVFSASAMWEYLRQEPVPVSMRSPLSGTAAAWMLGAIVLVGIQLFQAPEFATALTAAVVFLLGGLGELSAWLKHRTEFAPARDQLLTGLVGVLAGITLGLGLIGGITYHWIFGLAGGYGFIIAAFCGVSGVGFYLDTRKQATANH